MKRIIAMVWVVALIGMAPLQAAPTGHDHEAALALLKARWILAYEGCNIDGVIVDSADRNAAVNEINAALRSVSPHWMRETYHPPYRDTRSRDLNDLHDVKEAEAFLTEASGHAQSEHIANALKHTHKLADTLGGQHH